MNPILFDTNERNFTSNGLGRLSDCIRCTAQEVLNGIDELEMVYPVNGANYELLKEHNVIYALHDDSRKPQPFEIYRISRPIDGKVTVNAWHISYKLRKMVAKPFSATSAAEALVLLPQNIVGTNPFTFATDKTSAGSFTMAAPMAVKTLMGGVAGSIIDVFGGEWEYDGYNVNLRNRRGVDTSVKIKYGKNMTDVKKVSDASNIWCGILPYWNGNDENGDETSVVSNSVIWSGARSSYPYDMVIAVDASGAFDSVPTQAQLTSWGTQYVNNNARPEVPSSVTISFVELWQTEEYQNIAPLERLHLGDSVTVSYPELGIETKARVVSYKYDVLTERYTEMTLGEVRASFASAVQATVEEATKDLPTKNFINQSVDRATKMITGVTGGHVVLHLDANGEPYEILIMDTDDIATAVNVIRLNAAGIGFSTTGYNGTYTTAWTIDGHFLADIIDTGVINANMIKAGIIQALNGDSYWNLNNGKLSLSGTFVTNGTYNNQEATTYVDAGWLSMYKGSKKIIQITPFTPNDYPIDPSATSLIPDNSGFFYFLDAIIFSTYVRGSTIQNTFPEFAVYNDHSFCGKVLVLNSPSANTSSYGLRFRETDGTGLYEAGTSTYYIGNKSFTRALTVRGRFQVPQGKEVYTSAQTPVYMNSYGMIGTSSSSRRWKNSIRNLEDNKEEREKVIAGVLALKICLYKYNDGHIEDDDFDCDTDFIGIIAEDVADNIPLAAVRDSKDPENVNDWNDRQVLSAAILALQDAHQKLDAQAERIKNLEERLEKIERAING